MTIAPAVRMDVENAMDAAACNDEWAVAAPTGRKPTGRGSIHLNPRGLCHMD